MTPIGTATTAVCASLASPLSRTEQGQTRQTRHQPRLFLLSEYTHENFEHIGD
ncbi:hypothetical protein ACPOL_6452 [Acidisarcina polymorpha]|uniref:Uncharacterized protein n=1 Tax=Acidisarcina polymorpha TaxID=2211140 RepID=A0A2Z5G9U4_9BACT|nr:hypothetical protein ACPOL_6452 [Acidisarcina polymorpha]